ncbi:MAG: hypothetical protein ACOX5R_22760 [bacterium]
MMRTYELTWSPTTQPVKDQFLGYDSQGKVSAPAHLSQSDR